jgi:hypothetical protein
MIMFTLPNYKMLKIFIVPVSPLGQLLEHFVLLHSAEIIVIEYL